jgi:glycosyltransferase involved in cell wall biosynthesis
MTALSQPIRVFHAPHDVGGNAYYLARGERDRGFHSKNLVYTKQWFGYPADVCLKLKQDDLPTRYASWWRAMARIALSADVLHFNFGSSFLSYFPTRYVFADLPVWRALGIATFVTFQGCDSRISSSCVGLPINACTHCTSGEFCRDYYNNYKRETIAQARRYFDCVFAVNPDLLRNIPGGVFLPYSNCDLDDWTPPPDYDWHHAGPIRIVHAPTSREVKGTDAIIAAVERLKAEGHAIEFILVEKIPHDQVRKLYASADLLIDQVRVGWYGGLAVELMALGKPVVAYIREEDLHFVPAEMRRDLPVVSADERNLADVLRPLLVDAGLRKALGQRSREYVERWHHPKQVAAITTAAYREALERHPPVVGRINRIKTLMRHLVPTVRYYPLLCPNRRFHPVRLGAKLWQRLVGA